MLLGSNSLPDEEFLAAVEDCRFPADVFHHADHLRLGWVLLSTMPVELALRRAAAAVQRFASHNGKAERYHETITKGWMLLLASHDESDFREFLRCHSDRISAHLLHQYWNPETLASTEARTGWVSPDLQPLPEVSSRFTKT